ncbi:putative HNH homing endonuclease [Vibrio virus vB_VspP_SBP1]|uniref:Putative HNH homing endonuclease n=1 Tax=Vibrio virus vB_VspP_SBP1 TaxID=2500581 RepID=A0A3T0IIQ5_9CAUD|nr:putative HNH homing endonuclease [Vibrio virus vB_VspP_SBP1]AZU99644.1 putative HNH homing endonuclease [Vibrio virus vB_VspP_SBP1]
MTQKGTYRQWLNKVYGQQRSSSKTRNHLMPDYTKEELGQWITDNYANIFIDMFAAWVASGYEKNLVPSLDRLDDSLPYSLDNLQLLTWGANENKYRTNRERNKRNRTVVATSLIDGTVAEYPSSALAAEALSLSQTSISRAARGERKSYAGWHWKFKNTEWNFERK